MDKFDIVASNIRGLGAVQLVSSLLPALERVAHDQINRIWLPADGELSQYRGTLDSHRYKNIRRILPNSVSRLAECLLPALHYPPEANLLVLGDLPLRHIGHQIVFVHRPHLLESVQAGSIASTFSSWVSRLILQRNTPFVKKYIVQTYPMKNGLLRTFPKIRNCDVDIVSQPAPNWLLLNPINRASRIDKAAPLKLFYPSAVYPHKNHQLLYNFARDVDRQKYRMDIRLTCDAPRSKSDYGPISFLGRLSPLEMRAEYETVDALLFPSLEESYGLPIVEAISIGIPVICADRPYSRALCGKSAIYFDPTDTASLARAIADLRQRLAVGWWPDWEQQKRGFPKDWDAVASSMIAAFEIDSLSANKRSGPMPNMR
jgi:glycosyltransferase involved in cell wall biosynthesis